MAESFGYGIDEEPRVPGSQGKGGDGNDLSARRIECRGRAWTLEDNGAGAAGGDRRRIGLKGGSRTLVLESCRGDRYRGKGVREERDSGDYRSGQYYRE